MHKVISITKERTVVITVIILAINFSNITTIVFSSEVSNLPDAPKEIINVSYIEASSYYFNENSQLYDIFYDNGIYDYFNLTMTKTPKKDILKSPDNQSYSIWCLSHYLTYFRLKNFINYENWILGFLFFNHETFHKNHVSEDIKTDNLSVTERNTTENALLHKPTVVSSFNNVKTNSNSDFSDSSSNDEDDDYHEYSLGETNDEYSDGSKYYVAKNGDDSNNGKESSPWFTIQKAADTMVAGDTVFIKEGYYNERIHPENSGKAGEFITYTRYNNDLVVIDGSDISIKWGGLIHIYDKNHIRISGLKFKDSSCFGVYVTGSKSNNIIINNCHFENIASSMIQILGRYWLRQIHDITIYNNSANNICYNTAQEAISLSGINKFNIYNNFITNCPKHAINVKDGCANGYVFMNRINVSKGNGIYCDSFDLDNYNIDIYENIIWGKKTGITLATEHGGTLRDIKVYDNIVFTTGNAFQINNHTSFKGSHKKSNIAVLNNIFHNNSICILITDMRENFDDFTISNNILNSNGMPIYFVHLLESDVEIYNNFFNKEININLELLKV